MEESFPAFIIPSLELKVALYHLCNRPYYQHPSLYFKKKGRLQSHTVYYQSYLPSAVWAGLNVAFSCGLLAPSQRLSLPGRANITLVADQKATLSNL